MDLVTHVHEFLTSRNAITRRFILAVSGGSDSMVLLHVFRRLQLNFVVAHFNYGLRGNESDMDEVLVEQTCRKFGITCYTKRKSIAQTKDEKHISVQLAARTLRYEWFRMLIEKKEGDIIVTGHHRRDNLETFFINLLRGSGIRGLSGIPYDEQLVFRPFIQVAEEDILNYANQNSVTFREDQSNQETKYLRNNIRLTLLPKLKEIRPDAEENINHSVSLVKKDYDLLSDFVDSWAEKNIIHENEKTHIPATEILNRPNGDVLLFHLLFPFGFNSSQVNDIYNALIKKKKCLFYSKNFRLQTVTEKLTLSDTRKPEKFSLQLSGTGEPLPAESGFAWEIIEISDFKKVKNQPKDLFIDLKKLSFPLNLRSWKPGDRFAPLGMKTRKKISDFLNDVKADYFTKENILVLETFDNQIAGVPGWRIAEPFKVTAETTAILHIYPLGR